MSFDIKQDRVREAYAPPEFESIEREPGTATRGPLVTVITGVLLLQGIVQTCNAFACALLLLGSPSNQAEGTLVAVSQAMARAHALLFPIGVIPFAIFLVRANKTARALAEADRGATYTEVFSFTPSSMWWWFCVPLLSLVKPYEAVKAVWSASTPQEGELSLTDGNIVRTWFATWLLYWLTSRLNGVISQHLSVQARDVLIVVMSSLGVLACLCAARMVRALDQRQRRRASEIWH